MSATFSGSAAAPAASPAGHTWVTEAPIVYVEPPEVKARAAMFRAIVKAYGRVDGATTLATRMNGHSEHGIGIAKAIGRQYPFDCLPVFEYRLACGPVALMQLEIDPDEDVLFIKFLTTHPGTQTAGGIMVEYAVNRVDAYVAQRMKFKGGFLRLESLNAESTAAYLALGFVPTGKSEMTLDANTSALWGKVGGAWRLKTGAGAKYAGAGSAGSGSAAAGSAAAGSGSAAAGSGSAAAGSGSAAAGHRKS